MEINKNLNEGSFEEFNKKSLSPVPVSYLRNSVKTSAIKFYPVAFSMSTPKVNIGRGSPTRQSIKNNHLKKKSQYIPSFLRKPNKVIKK